MKGLMCCFCFLIWCVYDIVGWLILVSYVRLDGWFLKGIRFWFGKDNYEPIRHLKHRLQGSGAVVADYCG